MIRYLKMILRVIKKITVEPSMLFFFAGIYFLYTAFQPLIYLRVCEQYLVKINSSFTCATLPQSNSTEAKNILTQIGTDTSHWIRYTSICYAVPSLFVDCLLGSWGDYFGRKLPLIIPSVGQLLATIIYLLMSEMPSIPVYCFCIASAIAGMFGGPTSCMSASYSFISSVTDSTTRTTRMSILQAMPYIAGAVTPFIAGALLQVSNSTSVYAVSGGMFLLSAVYSVFLNEPNSEKKRIGSLLELVNPSHLWSSWATLLKPRSNRTYIFLLIIASLILQFATAGELDILYLFLTNLQYTPQQFSYFFGFKFLMAAISNLVLLPIVKQCGVSDLTVTIDGLVAKLVGLIVFGLSKDTPSILFSFVLDGFGIWAYSSFFSLISQTVSESEVGKLLGVVAFIGDISILLASAILNTVYPPLKTIHPGATHFLVALLILVSLGVLVLAHWLVRRPNTEEETPTLAGARGKQYGSRESTSSERESTSSERESTESTSSETNSSHASADHRAHVNNGFSTDEEKSRP
jgi:ABC-type phosphate/phosphonate transport system permease subunit